MLWRYSLLFAAQFGSVIGNGQHVLGSSGDGLNRIRDKLLEAEIIPTVIDDFPPALGFRASWKHDSADLGNTLKPKHLKKAPKVHLDRVESDDSLETILKKHATYVVVLTDPDAPSRDDPKWSEFCHWIATGRMSPSSTTSKHKLKDIIKYKAPAPPPKTGKHRYVFFAFIAANGTTEKLHLTKPKEREHWGSKDSGHGVREWALQNGLAPVERGAVAYTQIHMSTASLDHVICPFPLAHRPIFLFQNPSGNLIVPASTKTPSYPIRPTIDTTNKMASMYSIVDGVMREGSTTKHFP
ncbi:unnamed protein product [Fusarium graminearum]|nr:unnamed protein product [Fusarium graminearum]